MASALAQKRDDLKLTASLALYQTRRDRALGMNHLTRRAKNIVYFYNTKRQQAEQKILKSAEVLMGLKVIDGQMKLIMDEAIEASPDRRRELLCQARALQKQARKLSKQNG